MNKYYVYVYIDPRNFEEFYYGKGTGARKEAHSKGLDQLNVVEVFDNRKNQRIKAIKKLGLEPIIRVIARDLTEHEAFLVEKTLLWKLGKHLTNISSGNFSDKFRPHDTMYKKIEGFDFKNGIYYFNVGDGKTRCWEDFKEFGFISAGGGVSFKKEILSFEIGDIIVAYLKGYGYVGIGKILQKAIPIKDVLISNKTLFEHDLRCSGMANYKNDPENCEFVALVNWIYTVENRFDAYWVPKSGLYTTPRVKASLRNHPKTIRYIEQSFGVKSLELLLERNIDYFE